MTRFEIKKMQLHHYGYYKLFKIGFIRVGNVMTAKINKADQKKVLPFIQDIIEIVPSCEIKQYENFIDIIGY